MDFYSSLLNPTTEPQQNYQDSMMSVIPNQVQMSNNMPYQDPITSGGGYQQPMYQDISMGYQGQSMYDMGCPKINKAMILQEIQNYVFNVTKVPVSKVVKLDEIDNQFRHACVQVGDVSFLGINYFPVPALGINVAFYFCTACGSLYIQKDFM